MQCDAKIALVGETTLTHAIAEFLKSADDLGDELSAKEHDRLSDAFDALRNWTAPAATFGEAICAVRVAGTEFRMGQENDGLARPMLEAAVRFFDAAIAVPAMPAKRRWTRRATLKMVA